MAYKHWLVDSPISTLRRSLSPEDAALVKEFGVWTYYKVFLSVNQLNSTYVFVPDKNGQRSGRDMFIANMLVSHWSKPRKKKLDKK